MTFELLDIINVIVTFQLVAFSAFLFVRKAGQPSNAILGLQLFSQAAGIFNGFCSHQSMYFLDSGPYWIFAGYPFVFLWGPTFYLYVKSTAYKNFRLKGSDLFHFIPFFAALVFLISTFYPLDAFQKRAVLASSSYPLIRYHLYLDVFLRTQVLIYIAASIGILHSVRRDLMDSYSSISKTHLSWLEFLVAGFTAAYALTIPFIVIFGYRHENYYVSSLVSIIPYFIYFNIIFFKGWSNPTVFSGVEQSTKYKSSKLTDEEAERWIAIINEHVAVKKPYLDPDLTVNQLSSDLNLSPRVLSQIINEYFNRSFYDYINGLRIEESKKMLADSRNKKTVLEILYEVGFNTKSAYNSAFKKATGVTPTEYRKRILDPPGES